MKKLIVVFSAIVGVVGAGYLGGSAAGQNAKKPVPIGPAAVGLVDLEYVFKNYKRFTSQSEQLQEEFKQKRDELKGLDDRIKQMEEERKTFDPASTEYQRRDNEITRLRADLRAQAEQAEKDFARKDAAMLRRIYVDIQDIIRRTAESKNLTLVLQTHGTDDETGATPAGIRRDLNRIVLYSEPTIDVTKFVVFNLNRMYDTALKRSDQRRR